MSDEELIMQHSIPVSLKKLFKTKNLSEYDVYDSFTNHIKMGEIPFSGICV